MKPAPLPERAGLPGIIQPDHRPGASSMPVAKLAGFSVQVVFAVRIMSNLNGDPLGNVNPQIL